MAYFYKPNCKCPKDAKKCTCGASWAYIIDVGINPQTGKRQQKKKGGFKTKKEAEQAAAKLVNELAEGKTYIKESNITFKEFSKIWLQTYENTGKIKESTIRIRKHQMKRLMPYFEYLKLRSITGLKYQEALNDLKTKGYKENTIAGAHCTARMIFKEAKKRKIIAEDPTEYATVPKSKVTINEIETNTLPKYFEKEELAILLKTAKDKGLPLDYEIFNLLAYTGIRIGELCALKWNNISFEEKTIKIIQTYYNPTNNTLKYTLLPAKTKTSIRTIEVDQDIIKELKKHKSKQNELKMKHLDAWHNEDFVFTNIKKNYGYPILIKIIETRMKRLLKLTGLPNCFTPHSLRHTHASLLAEAKVSLEAIMERLGHKDDDTTRNIYLHVTKTIKKETSQKFSELMKGL